MRFFWCATWIVLLGSINSVLATLQVVEQPQNGSIAEGQSYIITCKFNEPVKCTWYRNGIIIVINGRYSFVSNTTGDCSLQITNTSAKFDNGSWQCVADSGSKYPVKSNKAFLTVQSIRGANLAEVRVVEQPKNATVANGQNHTVTCKFSDPVDCVWINSKSAVKIGGRRQYINSNGTDTKDCSFLIVNFGHADATSWQCAAMHGPGKNYTNDAVSDVIFLTFSNIRSKPLEIVVQPVSENVKPGDSHVLFCKFSDPVDCFWNRNGIEITIEDRYRYTSNNGIGTRDCSFKISNFSADFDAKFWQCKAFDENTKQMVASDNISLSVSQENTYHSRTTLGLTLYVVEQPTNATVVAGQTTNLTCKFNEPVNCSWTPTDVNSRYRYVSNNGKGTKDCSLQITNFDKTDAHSWQCVGTLGEKQVTSSQVVLAIQDNRQRTLQGTQQESHVKGSPTIPIVESPQNASLFSGQNHLMKCVFSQPVNCAWHVNGIPTTIEGRYTYGPDGGHNTVNCSFLMQNFTEHDAGSWNCTGSLPSDINTHGHSEIGYLTVQSIVQPNRTVILIDGNEVNEIWVPEDGSRNGTLQCVAEFAIPAVELYWNRIGNESSLGIPEFEKKCSTEYTGSCYCNSTLTWIGDWNQLKQNSTLSCYVVQFNSSNHVQVNVKTIKSDPNVSTGSMSAGAIAGIIVAVLLVVLIIVGVLVYFFVLKPRKKKNVPNNVTITPTFSKTSGVNVTSVSQASPAPSEKSHANSTPGNSAETVRMNDRKPQAAAQSPVKVPLVKKVDGESKPNNATEDSSDDSDEETRNPKTQEPASTRYSKPFAYIGKDSFPIKKKDGK